MNRPNRSISASRTIHQAGVAQLLNLAVSEVKDNKHRDSLSDGAKECQGECCRSDSTWSGIFRAGNFLTRLSVAAVMRTKVLLLWSLFTLACWATPGEHLQPGTRLPVIQESDQSGVTTTLDSLKGPEGTLLVIFRSADW